MTPPHTHTPPVLCALLIDTAGILPYLIENMNYVSTKITKVSKLDKAPLQDRV